MWEMYSFSVKDKRKPCFLYHILVYIYLFITGYLIFLTDVYH